MFKEKRKSIENAPSKYSDIVRFLIGIGIFLLSFFLIFNSIRSFQLTKEKLLILNKAQSEVADLRLKNITLLLQKERIESDDFTETDIRNRLNYSKKGEVIFVIPDELLTTSKQTVRDILKEEEKAEEQRSVFEQWVDIFVNGV